MPQNYTRKLGQMKHHPRKGKGIPFESSHFAFKFAVLDVQ